jgi:hypothetical protein
VTLIAYVAGQTSWAATINIPNSSFETATLSLSGNGTFSQLIAGSTIFVQGGTLGNWTASSTTVNATAGAFNPSPGGNNWTTTWWDGNNFGYLQESTLGTTASLSQTLADTLQDNTLYTLSALIGRRAFTPNFNYSLELFAGSTLLASASNLALASNSSGTDSALYTSGASDPNFGQNLEIVLTSTGGSGFTEAFFDKISLTSQSTSAVPEPSMVTLGGLAMLALLFRQRSRRRHH